MFTNRLNFNIENKRVGEETAIKIKYMLEEKFQLEQEVRAGEEIGAGEIARLKLEKLEYRLKINMMLYAGVSGKVLL